MTALTASHQQSMENDLALSPEEQAKADEVSAQIARYRRSILTFIKEVWGLTPQLVRPEYEERWQAALKTTGDEWEAAKETIDAEWFGTYDEGARAWRWHGYEKGRNLTWQQTLILIGIEKAVRGESARHLTIRSGHGIGKSATCSWIILWYLFCYYQAQVPCTAPTSQQMHDVLWKELAIWINRMPERFREVYEWQSDYIRVRYDAESWFARARTSTKENTEAIAGVHADHVAIVVDEASGVPEQVFNTAEGALTSGNVLVILISNPTRLTGYFYDSHHKNKADWQRFAFDCEQSPIVDREYVERQEKRHGRNSDEFRIRVAGEFPREEAMDDAGYVALVPSTRVIVVPSAGRPVFIGRRILGIDPSGEGSDEAAFVMRDRFRAEALKTINSTNAREIAELAITMAQDFELLSGDLVIDGFGIGAQVAAEIAIATQGKLEACVVLTGHRPKDEEKLNANLFARRDDEMDDAAEDLYLNLRALLAFRTRAWLLTGGQLVDGQSVDNSAFRNEVAVIKYKRSLHGNRIQLMPKPEMQKLRIPSPNRFDALSLTFYREIGDGTVQTTEEKEQIIAEQKRVDDRYAVL